MLALKDENENLKRNFQIICDNLPESSFKILGYDFFKKMAEKEIIKVYCINVDNELASVISVINYKNYNLINRLILRHLILKPQILISNIFKLFKSSLKSSKANIQSNYLHLLHLVIFKEKFKNYSIEEKDKIFDNFYKKILHKHEADTFFLCFNKSNLKALNYYERNNFKIFHKIGNILYYKKKYDI